MPTPRTDAAAERLRDLIVSGRLRAGDRLPAEAELSAQLGVSRGSLREAVRVLVAAGVLDVRQGDGTFVTALTPEVLLSGLAGAVRMMEEAAIADLIEARRLLEPGVTALAALRADADDLALIGQHLQRMQQAGDIDELVRHDVAFHHAVAAAAGNEVVTALLSGISGVTVRPRVWRGLIDGDARDRTISEHSAIATAIAAGDARLAEAAALIHVNSIETWARTAPRDRAADALDRTGRPADHPV